MKILLLSPYDAMSHRYWREGLVQQLAVHDFTVVTLPPRHFSWRFRGNSLTMAYDERLKDRYDLVIATSMTDLSSLKGVCPSLDNVPCVLFFHENQFAYPDSGETSRLVERQITSIYSALSADYLIFNSVFNRSTFCEGVSQFLKRMPDGIPPGLPQVIADKSRVIPVALRTLVESRDLNRVRSEKTRLLNIVWNHRWEHDKGVDELQTLVSALLKLDLEFRFHVIGQCFRQVPRPIQSCCEALEKAGRMGHEGFVENRRAYLQLLGSCHIVLSTARHEFQGLAVLEAMQAGCVPVVPDDLAYREFVPGKYRFQTQEEAINMIVAYHQQLSAGDDLDEPGLPDQVNWDSVQNSWRELLSQL